MLQAFNENPWTKFQQFHDYEDHIFQQHDEAHFHLPHFEYQKDHVPTYLHQQTHNSEHLDHHRSPYYYPANDAHLVYKGTDLYHNYQTNTYGQHHIQPIQEQNFQKPIFVQPQQTLIKILQPGLLPYQPEQPTKVVESHQASSFYTGANFPADIHDNYEHIEAVLEKLRDSKQGVNHENEDLSLKRHKISKRSFFGWWKSNSEHEDYLPKILSHQDRFYAGCLINCVFKKNNAVDLNGFPTLDGLTNLFTSGTSDQGFFVHVLRSVDQCLKAASVKHHIYREKVPLKGEICEVALDVIDCITHSITQYCSYV